MSRIKVVETFGVRNQFVIESEGEQIFQSYGSIIARKTTDGVTWLDEVYWNYSTTTGKYRNKFLGEDKATTQKKIDSGEYLLTNLN